MLQRHDGSHVSSFAEEHELSHRDFSLQAVRDKAIADVANSEFNIFHWKILFVAGAGFFTDAYDIFTIGIVSTILGYLFTNTGTLSSGRDISLKMATSIGVIIGPLVFGWLADHYGRKRTYGFELLIIIICTLCQAIAGQSNSVSIIGALIFWRIIMGVGIGGDYPSSALIASEFSGTKFRGALVTAVFASQGWGNLFAAIVSSITLVAFGRDRINDLGTTGTLNSNVALDQTWRIMIGLGCVPAIIALWFRLSISETPYYTADIEGNILKAQRDVDIHLREGSFEVDPGPIDNSLSGGYLGFQADQASSYDFFSYFGKWVNLKILLATSICWFVTDFVFYGLIINNTAVLQAIGFVQPLQGKDVYSQLVKISEGNLIIAGSCLLPGYYLVVLLVERLGRKPIQLFGFGMLTVLFIIIIASYRSLIQDSGTARPRVLMFLYCLLFFFLNFGPNSTSFVVPSELFPTKFRATAHGISTASGKLGAIFGQIAITYLTHKILDKGNTNSSPSDSALDNGIRNFLIICACAMLTGFLVTLVLPETRGRNLDKPLE